MSNTYTNVNDTKVMSDVIAALNHGLTPTRVFTIDVGSDPAVKNGTVQVPIASARTGETYNTTYESGNTTIAGQTVTLNTHLFCSGHITEEQAATSGVKLFEASMVEAAYGLAAMVQNTIMNVITVANFGSTEDTDEETIPAASFDADAVSTIRNICTKNNKWRELRPGLIGALVLDGDYTSNLMSDPAVRDLSASGDGVLSSGMLGRKYGFDIYENNTIVSSTPGSGENLVGFAVQPSAIAAAIRPIQPLGGAALEFEGIVTDPDSEISLSYRRWVNTGTGDLWGTVTVLMGVNKVDGNRLVRIVSA